MESVSGVPPSPLREQIAHAIREAQARYWVRQAGYGYRPHRDAAEAAAAAVLPLVEAAAAAEREAAGEQIVAMTRIALDRGEAAGRAAERLRLHTQLRYRRDAAMRNAQDVADERGSRAELGYFQTLAEAYDNAIGLLGVAATPQPEGHDA